MLGKLKKVFALGIKAAKITKKEVQKEINAMVKAGIINKNEGRQFLNKIMAEANAERKKFQCFVASEVRKELKKARPLVREVAKRGKLVAKRTAPKIKKVASKAMRKAGKRAVKKAKSAVKKRTTKKRAAKSRVKVKSIRKKKK